MSSVPAAPDAPPPPIIVVAPPPQAPDLGSCRKCRQKIKFAYPCGMCKVVYCRHFCQESHRFDHLEECRDFYDPPQHFFDCKFERCLKPVNNRNWVTPALKARLPYQYANTIPSNLIATPAELLPNAKRQCRNCLTYEGDTIPPPDPHVALFRKLFEREPLLRAITACTIDRYNLLPELIQIIVSYCTGLVDEWIDYRPVHQYTWFFGHIDKVEWEVTIRKPPTKTGTIAVRDLWVSRAKWSALPTAPPPSDTNPVRVCRVHFNELRAYDTEKMTSGNPYAPEPLPKYYKPGAITSETCPGGEYEAAKPSAFTRWGARVNTTNRPIEYTGVWYVVTEAGDDGLSQIQMSGYETQVYVPRPSVCFAGDNSQVMTAAGEWKSVWTIQTGDRLRAPVLDCVSSAISSAKDVPYTVQTVAEVHTTYPDDDFRLVAFGDSANGCSLQLTRGHPVFAPVANGDASKYEWRRPDEIATPIRQFVRRLTNFTLSGGGSHTVLARVSTAGATNQFLVCSTIGADCGERLAAEHPNYHAQFGPSRRIQPNTK